MQHRKTEPFGRTMGRVAHSKISHQPKCMFLFGIIPLAVFSRLLLLKLNLSMLIYCILSESYGNLKNSCS